MVAKPPGPLRFGCIGPISWKDHMSIPEFCQRFPDEETCAEEFIASQRPWALSCIGPGSKLDKGTTPA